VVKPPAWQYQVAPLPLPILGYSGFGNQTSRFGYSDSEIYLAGGGNNNDIYFWKWNGSTWLNIPIPQTANPYGLWGTPDRSKLYLNSFNGLFKSVDHGLTWSLLFNPGLFNSQHGLVGFGDTPDIIYFAGRLGLIRASTNQGATFPIVADFTGSYAGFHSYGCFATGPNDIWFYGINAGSFGPSDPLGAALIHYDGTSWSRINTLSSLLAFCSTMWSPAPGELYAGGYRHAGQVTTLFRSTDNAATWHPEALPSPNDFTSGVIGTDSTNVYATYSTLPTDTWSVARRVGGSWVDDFCKPGLTLTGESNPPASGEIWVNPATDRAIIVAQDGQLQTNRDVTT